METLKKLSEQAFKLVAFFSGIPGPILVIFLLSNADAFVVGLSVGESIDVRIANLSKGFTNVKMVGFGIGYTIILCLDMAILVTRLAVKVNIEDYKDKAKEYANKQNKALVKLGDWLCALSVVISLTSVGVFMFAGLSFDQFKELITTPVFYAQTILFLAIALGVPSSISYLANYISVKYAFIIGKLIHKIEKAIETDIDNSLNFKKEKKGTKTIEEILNI